MQGKGFERIVAVVAQQVLDAEYFQQEEGARVTVLDARASAFGTTSSKHFQSRPDLSVTQHALCASHDDHERPAIAF